MHFSSLALAFAHLDRLIRSPGHNKEDRLAVTRDMLANAGFDDCVYGQPYEILQSLVQPYHASRTNAKEELWQTFMDPASTFTIEMWHLSLSPVSPASNYIVMYMRLLTSAQMRVDEQFADFLFDPESQMQTSVDDFCRRFVEPLGKEAGECTYIPFSDGLPYLEKKNRSCPGSRPRSSIERPCQGCLPGWTCPRRPGQLCRFFRECIGRCRSTSFTVPVSGLFCRF